MNEPKTTTLFHELNNVKKNQKSYQDFIDKHQADPKYSSLVDFLNHYFREHPDLTASQISLASNLSLNYVYPIMNGGRLHPTKYKLVAFCIGCKMSLEETQQALTLAGCARLYPKLNCDIGIIICINQGCSTVTEVEAFLAENNVDNPFGESSPTS